MREGQKERDRGWSFNIAFQITLNQLHTNGPLPLNTGTTVAHFGHKRQCHTQLVTAVLDGAWDALRR